MEILVLTNHQSFWFFELVWVGDAERLCVNKPLLLFHHQILSFKIFIIDNDHGIFTLTFNQNVFNSTNLWLFIRRIRPWRVLQASFLAVRCKFGSELCKFWLFLVFCALLRWFDRFNELINLQWTNEWLQSTRSLFNPLPTITGAPSRIFW